MVATKLVKNGSMENSSEPRVNRLNKNVNQASASADDCTLRQEYKCQDQVLDLKLCGSNQEVVEAAEEDRFKQIGGTVDNKEPECFFCGATKSMSGSPADLTLCEHCGDVHYCSQAHLEIHRPEGVCFPFVIKRTTELGRFMVAARNIKPLELILKEDPAVVGPYNGGCVPGCLQCFRKISDISFTCPRCGFPMCGPKCAGGTLHREECNFFQRKGFKLLLKDEGCYSLGKRPQNSSEFHIYITPLRMLLKKGSDQKTFNKINMLMDNLEKRSSAGRCLQNNFSKQVVDAMMTVRNLCQTNFKNRIQNTHEDNDSQADLEEDNDFGSPELLQRMLGILRTNGMKLDPHGSKHGVQGVALYPVYCLINHACYSNTNYVKFPDHHLELRSQMPIQKGEEIFTRYVSATLGNIRRRDDIRRNWHFDCKCKRCWDPTEFGSYMSAVRCFDCRLGYLLPEQSLQYESDWFCDKCGSVFPHSVIEETITTIENQISELGMGDIFAMEEMLFHYSEILHPNNYILTDIMHNLIHLYATKKTLTRPEKERKVQLCSKVMETLSLVDPGYTKWKGTLLQELLHPFMVISKEDHNNGVISTSEFHRRLTYCTRSLNTAKKCLRGGFTPVEEFIRQKRDQALRLAAEKQGSRSHSIVAGPFRDT